MIISTLNIVAEQNESRQIDVSVIVVTIISTIFAFYIKQQSDEIDIFNHITYIRLNGVGARVGSMEEVKENKKFYTILQFSQ